MTENAIVIAKRTATNFHLDLAGRLVAVSTSLLPLIEGFPPPQDFHLSNELGPN